MTHDFLLDLEQLLCAAFTVIAFFEETMVDGSAICANKQDMKFMTVIRRLRQAR